MSPPLFNLKSLNIFILEELNLQTMLAQASENVTIAVCQN